MATQGLVSVVDLDTNEVLFKVIAGCNGYNAKKLSELLSVLPGRSMTISMIIDMAKSATFGCDDCLVVMDRNSSVCTEGDLHDRYRMTFNDPKFNPRWESGKVEYSEIVYTTTK
jgi:hypothetical protein